VTLAAIENSIHVMDSFLHSGQKFDLQIPLQNALAQMNYEIAEMLVNSGADPSPFKDNMNLKKREKFSQVHDIFKKGAESFSLHFILPENPLPIYNSSPVIHPITVIKQKIPDKHT
jgi:hypothetical protein